MDNYFILNELRYEPIFIIRNSNTLPVWVNFAVVTNSIEHSVWKLIPRMQTSAVIWHKGSSSCCKLTASVQMPTHYKKCEENSPTLQTDIQTTKTFHNFIRKPTAWQPCVVTTVNITTVHCTDRMEHWWRYYTLYWVTPWWSEHNYDRGDQIHSPGHNSIQQGFHCHSWNIHS